MTQTPARWLAAILLASAALQTALCWLPDTMGDILNYRLWARALAQDGLAEAYWPSHPLVVSAERLDAPIDYPPVVPYVLLAVGRACALLSCSDALLDFLIRFPFVLANLAIGLLIFADARRGPDASSATLAASLYLLNPGAIFDTTYWGQADALCALFLVASVVALGRDRPEWAWACLGLGMLTKPLAWPFAPLVALATLKRFGWTRTLRSAGVLLVCTFAVFVPFAWVGRLGSLLRSLVFQLDAMPYASVNAHNLWWLVERGTPWLDAREKAFGPVSYETLGLALFASFYALTLFRLWRSEGDRSLRLAFASVGLGFFVLVTHMHENHVFNALPLLLLVGVGPPRVKRLFVLVSITFMANMLLHDPYLTHVFRPHAWGPLLLLPQEPRVDPHFFDYFLAHGYPHFVDEIRGDTSLLGVVLTVLDSQANVLIFVYWLWSFYGRGGFDAAFTVPETPFPWRWALPATAVFVLATGVAFVSRALRDGRPGIAAPASPDRGL